MVSIIDPVRKETSVINIVFGGLWRAVRKETSKINIVYGGLWELVGVGTVQVLSVVSVVDPVGKETCKINIVYGGLWGVDGDRDSLDPPSGIRRRSC